MSLFFWIFTTFLAYVSAQNQPSCSSKIYCQGPLLHTVQMAGIYKDSKTFVDKMIVNSEETTLNNFNKFLQETNNKPTKENIEKFVNENFKDGNELENWSPPDFTLKPKFLSKIKNKEFKYFAGELVKLWAQFARKVKKEVLTNPQQYTLIPVKEGFIVPGGRFEEFYYWDSYWIIKGLLLCGMHNTVKSMLENFFTMVEKFGYVPNGARIYYLNRSQPPLLTVMVAEYFHATNNTSWLQNNIQILDKELTYWLKNKTISIKKDGVGYKLAHYKSNSGSPRPESYREDYKTVSFFSKEEDKIECWADLKSGAESGWDFSSRWIVDDNGGVNANLTFIQARRIIPVDLNSFLCQAFEILGGLHWQLRHYTEARKWFVRAQTWRKSIHKVFYHEQDGIWYDYDSKVGKHRRYFYPSNFAPLWSEIYNTEHAKILGDQAVEYFLKQNITKYKGGIPASLINSGQQWDLPNAWPPLQSIVLTGLDKSGSYKAKKVAKKMAEMWIHSNLLAYNKTGKMFEKYNSEQPGQPGSGGEYEVQTGFGWSNGVIFEFIDRFFTEK